MYPIDENRLNSLNRETAYCIDLSNKILIFFFFAIAYPSSNKTLGFKLVISAIKKSALSIEGKYSVNPVPSRLRQQWEGEPRRRDPRRWRPRGGTASG